MCSILPPWRRNSNLYIKYRISFEIRQHVGNFEHRPYLKKSPTRGGKTMLNGVATPSRIFGLAFRLKKSGRKKIGHIFKFVSNLKRCSKLPSSTVHNEISIFLLSIWNHSRKYRVSTTAVFS